MKRQGTKQEVQMDNTYLNNFPLIFQSTPKQEAVSQL